MPEGKRVGEQENEYNNIGETCHRIGYETTIQPKRTTGRRAQRLRTRSWWGVYGDRDGKGERERIGGRSLLDWGPPKSEWRWEWRDGLPGTPLWYTDTVVNVMIFIEKSLGN